MWPRTFHWCGRPRGPCGPIRSIGAGVPVVPVDPYFPLVRASRGPLRSIGAARPVLPVRSPPARPVRPRKTRVSRVPVRTLGLCGYA